MSSPPTSLASLAGSPRAASPPAFGECFAWAVGKQRGEHDQAALAEFASPGAASGPTSFALSPGVTEGKWMSPEGAFAVMSTRRCLVNELDELEDCGEGKRVDTLNAPLSAISASSTCASDIETSPIGGEAPTPQKDAWSLGDWKSPPSSRRTSPCGAARTLEKGSRDIADAVLNDLQIDLDSQTQRAVGQLSAWISEEISFARKGLEDDMKATIANCEKGFALALADSEVRWASGLSKNELMCASANEEIHNTRTTLDRDIDELRTQLSDESIRPRSSSFQVRGHEDHHSTSEHHGNASAAVIEARAVAEGRRLRVMQESVDAQKRQLEKLCAQCNDFVARLDTHESDFAALQSRLKRTEVLTQSLAASDADVKQVMKDVVDLRETGNRLHARISQHDNVLDSVGAEVKFNRHALDEQGKKSDDLSLVQATLSKQVAKHEADLESLPGSFRSVVEAREVRIKASTAELASSLANCVDTLSRKADVAELDDTRDAIHTWVDQAREAHRDTLSNLSKSLEEVKQSVCEQQTWMHEASPVIQDVQSRTEKLDVKLTHFVDNVTPEQLYMWADCLECL